VSAPTFEVLAFRALPVTSAVVVLELEGRFTAPAVTRLGRPALLVEVGRERFELLPVPRAPDAAAGPGGVPWRASFAVGTEALEGASFALEVGRHLLVDLPEPDLGPGDRDEGERLARLAREANGLRARLDAAAAEADELRARLDAAAAEVEEAGRQVEAVRSQSDLLLAQAREDAEAALAAERERHEREVAAVREQANHSLATAEDEAEQAMAAVRERAEAERARHERELAAVREQADQALATALASQRAELTKPKPAPPPAPGPKRPARPPRAPASTAETEVIDTGNDETVRFLSGRRRPRHSAEDEHEPPTLAAGATRAGARSIGSGGATPSASRRREPQRIGALVALAIAIAAFVLVVVLRVGPF
jgi:hypothetical protein